MTKGIDFDADDGRITIVNGDRVVATTDGTLICVLPDLLETTEDAIFPDLQKSDMYVWTSSQDYFTIAGTYTKGQSCTVFITAIPQEYSDKVVLADAPAGADFFIGHVRLSRTTSPLSTWMGDAISVLPPQDQWLVWSGSCLVEAAENMSRVIHVYIDDDSGSPTYRKLVLEVQQSVGPAVGGWTNSYSSGNPTLDYVRIDVVNGNNTITGATNGFPVALRAGYKSQGWTSPTSNQGLLASYRWNGGSPCARSDTTSYTSVYSVDIRGRFGRRS